MTDAYDHNQTVVPDAFLKLYVKRERLTVDRAELEARSDFCESLAVQAERHLPPIDEDDRQAQREVLLRAWEALTQPPAQVTSAEAGWVVGRMAELRGWDAPELPTAAEGAGRSPPTA